MQKIFDDTEKFFSKTVMTHGPTPKGVDWKDESSQLTRFEQLLKIIDSSSYTLNDIGCGYGELVRHLDRENVTKYRGYDLSESMILAAKKENAVNFAEYYKISNPNEMEVADYSVASGIFNLKLDHSEADWLHYILKTIDTMADKSRLGFSFNCLTSYSDKEKMRSDLYYCNPLFIFDYCKRSYSRNVALLHDYSLWEFTVLVRKI